MTRPHGAGTEVDPDRLVALAARVGPGPTPGPAHGRAGGLSGPRRGEGGDLFDLRPFQEGDDPRWIDPAATARSGRAQVRRRHEEVERTLLLVADFRAPMLWGTRGRFRSVAAAEALALEGWRAVRAGARVGAIILRNAEAELLAPRPRETAMLRVAGALGRVHAAALAAPEAAHDDLATILDRIVAEAPPGASVCLATGLDDPGPAFGPAAAALMRKCPFEVLLVQDAVETSPPPGTLTARLGRRVVRGRFGPSPAREVLARLGVPVRIVNASGAVGAEAPA
ncbi:DUF58 domain-containing protein [uncultured Jannaschia sp.]|uniref:DUF58 domain-containing protein n=1 Tax=uncultured Jannaschia sp. TaxID=293347 RepID=UPI002633BE77|nr:DUF58 domain-containing protein [uncultured Jannaschia sp.]